MRQIEQMVRLQQGCMCGWGLEVEESKGWAQVAHRGAGVVRDS